MKFDDKILQLIIDKFGITNEPYNGSSFILPNGAFLDLRNYNSHSDVEKYLIDNGYSDYKYNVNTGSPTLKSLGCIRVNVPKYYVWLTPNQITKEQYVSLLKWLKYLVEHQSFTNKVDILGANGWQGQRERIDEVSTPEDVINKIKERNDVFWSISFYDLKK